MNQPIKEFDLTQPQMQDEKKQKNENGLKFLTTGANIFFFIVGLFSILPAIFSPMMMDDPRAGESLSANMLMFAVMTFPIVVVISLIRSRIEYHNGNYKKAGLISVLPTINFLVGLLALIIIEFFCHGNFSCF